MKDLHFARFCHQGRPCFTNTSCYKLNDSCLVRVFSAFRFFEMSVVCERLLYDCVKSLPFSLTNVFFSVRSIQGLIQGGAEIGRNFF